MKIDIYMSSDGECLLPFSHQPALAAVVNKWLGENNPWHGKSALYSFSLLEGGRVVKALDSLAFAHGAMLSFGAHDPELIRLMIENIRRAPELFNGLVAREVTIIPDPDLSSREIFYPASPIFLKKSLEGGGTRHVLYTDEEAAELLTERFRAKMEAVGLVDPTMQIFFAPEEGKHSVKLISYRNIKNKASWCPVRIKGMPSTKLFAWNTGLGHSTGIGFGAIK